MHNSHTQFQNTIITHARMFQETITYTLNFCQFLPTFLEINLCSACMQLAGAWFA